MTRSRRHRRPQPAGPTPPEVCAAAAKAEARTAETENPMPTTDPLPADCMCCAGTGGTPARRCTRCTHNAKMASAVKSASESTFVPGATTGPAPRRRLLDGGPDAGPEPTVEHAIRMSGGDMQVRNPGAHVERIFPLAEWIECERRLGGKVYTRTIVVVEDWHEVTA